MDEGDEALEVRGPSCICILSGTLRLLNYVIFVPAGGQPIFVHADDNTGGNHACSPFLPTAPINWGVLGCSHS